MQPMLIGVLDHVLELFVWLKSEFYEVVSGDHDGCSEGSVSVRGNMVSSTTTA